MNVPIRNATIPISSNIQLSKLQTLCNALNLSSVSAIARLHINPNILAGDRISASRLKQERIIPKQIPKQIKDIQFIARPFAIDST
jgi:hypothetical protein